MDTSEQVSSLAELVDQRNAIDAEIAKVIGRPALQGHIGEWIAARAFDIELHDDATKAGSDGVFRSGRLAGKSVNVKWYAAREGILDIPASLPDVLLALCGPRRDASSSRGGHRPLVIAEVFAFDARGLVDKLGVRGVKIGIATSVRREEWEAARVWRSASAIIDVGDVGEAVLARFRECEPAG